MRFRMLMIVSLVLCAATVLTAQTFSPPSDEMLGDQSLAERMAQAAQRSLAGKAIVPATLRQSAALLEAAIKLNPGESRFPRLLVEAYLQLGGQEGRDGALASLKRYLKLEPADVVAQIQLIDLYFGEMETADARKTYIDQLLANDALSPEVKAHVDVMAAELAIERIEDAQARQYVEQALKLMPLSPEALRLKHRKMDDNGPALPRIQLLLQMLRSNPAQSGAMTELASELADAGLVDPSLYWYQNAFNLLKALGQPPGLNDYTDYCTELVIANQLVTADVSVQNLIDQDASNSDAAFLSLLIAKRGGDKAATETAVGKVRSAVLTRLSRISDRLNDKTTATTQASTDVDIPADTKKLAEMKDSNLAGAYASGLADMAWLEIYFNRKTEGAQTCLTALRQLVPSDNVVLTRLEGWSYLVDGKKDEARVKLSAVADRDPLAELGMVQMDGDQPAAQPNAAVRKMLNDHASGLIGAILIEAVRATVGLMPSRDDAPQIRAELDKFPKDWLKFLEKPSDFYTLKAAPFKVSHSFGEPMLARVTIANTGAYDITIGPDGAPHPDLWMDARVNAGLAQQYVAGAAIDRIGRRTMLKPKESISFVVRVDQDQVSTLLQQNPTVAITLFFSVLSNPITQQSGIAPGPGGYRAQFTPVLVRSAAPAQEATLQTAYTQLLSGKADVRMRALDLLGAFSHMLKDVENAQLKGKGTELTDVIRKSTGDTVPAVRAVATVLTAALSDPAVRDGIIRQMLTDQVFQQRVAGLLAVQLVTDPVKCKEWVKPLADNDSDPLIRKLAASVIEVADLPPPATQPTTQETSLPKTK